MPKEKVRIRKAPKFLPFMILFGVVGLLFALFLNANIDEESRTSQPILGYLVGYLVALGAILGLIVALVIDLISRKRAKTVEATRSR
jgi:multisubunit Na+/H+ antiporter MnhB subunit